MTLKIYLKIKGSSTGGWPDIWLDRLKWPTMYIKQILYKIILEITMTKRLNQMICLYKIRARTRRALHWYIFIEYIFLSL